jgi:hypothetical protein
VSAFEIPDRLLWVGYSPSLPAMNDGSAAVPDIATDAACVSDRPTPAVHAQKTQVLNDWSQGGADVVRRRTKVKKICRALKDS